MEELFEISFNADWAGSSWSLDNVTYYDIDKNVTTQTSLAKFFSVADGITSLTSMASIELVTIQIPTFITELRSYCFAGCDNLIEVVLNDGLNIIHTRAFYNCNQLQDLYIPDSVTEIEELAFTYCSSLKTVKLSNNIAVIPNDAFGVCRNLTSIIIPDSVTEIGDSAFAGCALLSSISLGENLTTINSHAFILCEQLKNVVLPKNLTYIGSSAFSDSGLVTITIPDSIATIESYAFGSQHNLENIISEPFTAEAANKIKAVLAVNNSNVVDLVTPKVFSLYSHGKPVIDFPNAQVVYYYGVKIWEREQTKSWEDYGERGEYIQNTANSYIDLGFIPIADSGKTEFSFVDNNGGNSTYGAWGYIQNDNVANRIAAGITVNSTFAGIGNTVTSIVRVIGTKYTYVIDRKNLQFYVNNVVRDLTISPTTPINVYFMHRNGGNGVYGSNLAANYYFLREYDDNEDLIINLIPLHVTKQPITDAAGRVHNIGDWIMYDTITNTVPAHYGTFTGATALQVLASQQQALQSLGVEFTNDINTNQQQLNSLGVKI